MTVQAHDRQPPLTAVVHAEDGIRFVATADRPAELVAQLVGYIRARCEYTLWPEWPGTFAP
jgi:hypothetical protein